MIRQEEIDRWMERIEEREAREAADQEPRKKGRAYRMLHEDDDLVVVDKAPGIPVIPERDQSSQDLLGLLGEKYDRLMTVHRIDKGTSGVLLFARSEEAHRELNRQFRERETIKEYLAICEGEAEQDEYDVDIPLGPASGNRMKPSASGKEALTRIEVDERFRGFTLVRARPKTGRQHQIRVHCAAIGLPLLVDPLYGNADQFLLSSIKRKYRDYGREERPLIDRLTLHAHRLTVVHPTAGESMSFEADPPKDFRAVVKQLRKVRPAEDDRW